MVASKRNLPAKSRLSVGNLAESNFMGVYVKGRIDDIFIHPRSGRKLCRIGLVNDQSFVSLPVGKVRRIK